MKDKRVRVKCPAVIRIGTRSSDLAVKQAEEVRERILNAFSEQIDPENIKIIKMETTGDRIQDRSLFEIGGKGLFTKEIEEALLEKEIDIAVHSMKDMPDTLPQGLDIPCILDREDPRDAFLSLKVQNFFDIPKGSVIGTSSIRRETQILKLRPDLKILGFRGNVNTRLRKLKENQVYGTFLAVAGLKRLGFEDKISCILDTEEMLPSVAQGAIGVECLENNSHITNVLKIINHAASKIRVDAERTFLKTLGGSCSSPIAGFAEFTTKREIFFRGLISNPEDPEEVYKVSGLSDSLDANKMVRGLAEELLKKCSHLL